MLTALATVEALEDGAELATVAALGAEAALAALKVSAADVVVIVDEV